LFELVESLLPPACGALGELCRFVTLEELRDGETGAGGRSGGAGAVVLGEELAVAGEGGGFIAAEIVGRASDADEILPRGVSGQSRDAHAGSLRASG
jgi:hypothetical protein